MRTIQLCHCFFSLIVLLGDVWFVSSYSSKRLKRAVSEFGIPQLLGQWYDLRRTTTIWGENTWTSQQWNFVQGQDGTVVALFNGMCKACGACSDTYLYKVTQQPHSEREFLLQGNGGTVLFQVTSDLNTEIVASLCFNVSQLSSSGSCPESYLQISLLSRQQTITSFDRWSTIVEHLPQNTRMNTESGDDCPKLYIDPKLVTRDLVNDTDIKLLNVVGFQRRRSAIVLPCSVDEHFSSLQENTQVVWVREQSNMLLTKNETVLKRANGAKLLHRSAGQFDLLLREVSYDKVDIYACYLSEVVSNEPEVVLSRVAVSSADFASSPTIVYHSKDVTANQGEMAVLECYANGNPPPSVSWWMKSSDTQEAYVLKGKGGNKLKIGDVQVSDEGVYKCEASTPTSSPVSALVNLRVDFPPMTKVDEKAVSVPFGAEMTLTCFVTMKISHSETMIWKKDNLAIKPDSRRSVSLIQESEFEFELTLFIRNMRKEDFGQYSCFAQDCICREASVTNVTVTEKEASGDMCTINNIPVMNNFDVQQFLGDMQRMETTSSLWGNDTYMSEVQGFFITVGGSLMQYYRGFSTENKHCLEPGASSLVRLDTPGDYLVSVGNIRGRYKIMYTDYTHAVTYFCISGDDHKECPPHLKHVQILSRQPHIPDNVLQLLYGYVQKACVPVSSLIKTVPGICQMPVDFMYKKGWIGHYPVLNCQVAKLRMQGNVTSDHVTGTWRLIGEVRPNDYTAVAKKSLHIIHSKDRLICLHRGTESELCSSIEADVLHESAMPGSYYYEYKGRTVDSKFVHVDNSSLVLYTCLALKHDGTCYKGSELVELYQRHHDTNSSMDDHSMLWLIRAVANACVDIKRLVRIESSDSCPVPDRVVKAAASGLVNGHHTHIGCHQSLIAVDPDINENKVTGHWTVVYRSIESPSDSSSNDEFSKTYHIVQREKGQLMLLVRQYESAWKMCAPTRVLTMTQVTRPGDYVHVSHSITVSFKVLSVSEDTAVVYWCQDIGTDGVCQPDGLTVEIWARSSQTPISRPRMLEMQQISIDVCVSLDSLQAVMQEEKCSIPDRMVALVTEGQVTAAFDIPVLTCKDQILQGIQNLDVEDLTGKWTVLWRNEEFWGVQSPNAESSYVIPTSYGLLYLWRSLNNDLQRCAPEEVGRFIRTSGPGDYYSGFDGVPVAMKIMKMTSDNSSMLGIWCHLDNESQCYPHLTSIEIISRNTVLENDTRDELFEAVDLSCMSSAEWVPSEPDVCNVENDVLTTVYIDGLESVEYSRIGCRVDLIEGQQGVTDDMIIGSWQSVYQSKLSDIDGPGARAEFHFTKMSEGPISLIYRLYSTEKQECLPTSMMELTRDRQKSGTVFQLRYCDSKTPYGFAYMLYVDEGHLAMLLCQGMQNDGGCSPDHQNLVLLHREGHDLEVNDTLLEAVIGLGADACVDPNTLVNATLEPCPVPESILMDANNGQLEVCAESGAKVQCYPRYVPVHGDFKQREFLGTWYTVGDTVTDGSPTTMVRESVTYHFADRKDGTVAMLYTVGSSGICQPTQMRVLKPSGDGQFFFNISDSQGLLKVVWMDENSTVIYWCFEVNGDEPWCPNMDVSVLSRQQQTTSGQELAENLQNLIVDLCVSSENFVASASGSCVIPEDIVFTVEEGTTNITAPYSVIQCARQFIPAVADFNMTEFSGVWHTISQTTQVWGNATWESPIRSFVERDNGTAVMAFTGHPPGESHCVPMDLRMLSLPSQTGEWTFKEGNITVITKVVWTDYNTSALLYTCLGDVGKDGLCPASSLQVELLSRTSAALPKASEVMERLLPSLCVEELESFATGLCQITKELEHLVGSQTDGETDTVTPCRVQDIPLEKNFTLHQMTGTWFEIARTRFTFNTMESVISVYNYNAEKGYLDGLFIGTLHKQCQSPLQSTTKKKFSKGSDSIIEGRIQVGDSIFPWITFNILYYDGDMLMHMACYTENEDGTCPRDKTEVTLLGRSRQLTDSMEKKLKGLMHNVCLERKDLVPTKETANCLPKLMTEEEETSGLPDTSKCPLGDVPVVENLDEETLFGTWYGLGSVDYSSTGDPTGFIVSISRSTTDTLKWRHWNIRNGSCLGEKAVFMKAACEGNKTGDYISTKGSSFMLQWTTFKILRLEGDLMLVYSCTQETYEGICTPEGIRVELLGRSTAVAVEDMIPLLDALPSVCLKPEYMTPVVSTAECTSLTTESAPITQTSACAVDKLPSIDIDMEQMPGLWYEMAHTRDKMFPMQKAIMFYKPLPHEQMAMFYVAMNPMGQCMGPMQGDMRARCHSNPDSKLMGRLKFPGIWSWAPLRILHADFNTSMIVMSCMDEQKDGSCSAQGLKIHITTRDPNPSAELRKTLYDTLTAFNCFDIASMEDVFHEGPSCKHKLDPLMAPVA